MPYLLNDGRFDPTKGPLIHAAWTAILEALRDGEPHRLYATTDRIARDVGVKPKTVANLIGSARRAGYFEIFKGERGAKFVRQVKFEN